MAKSKLLYTKCNKCGVIILKAQLANHSCGIITFFKYRVNHGINISESNFLKMKFNINDNTKLSKSIIENIEEFRNNPINQTGNNIENINTNLIKLPDGIGLDTSTAEMLFAENENFYLSKFNRLDFNLTFNKKDKVIKYNDKELLSFFTLNQVLHLASGVQDKKIHDLYRKIIKVEKLQDEQWVFLIHSIENILTTYGVEKVNRLLELSKLPHQIGEVKNIFKVINDISKNNEKPTIRLRHNGVVFTLEPYTLSKKRYANVLTINKINQSGKKTHIGFIGSSGYMYKNQNYNTPIIPTIELIIKWNSDIKSAIAYYGVETGECSICGRKLTDRTSIKIGIGPVCRNNMNY